MVIDHVVDVTGAHEKPALEHCIRPVHSPARLHHPSDGILLVPQQSRQPQHNTTQRGPAAAATTCMSVSTIEWNAHNECTPQLWWLTYVTDEAVLVVFEMVLPVTDLHILMQLRRQRLELTMRALRTSRGAIVHGGVSTSQKNKRKCPRSRKSAGLCRTQSRAHAAIPRGRARLDLSAAATHEEKHRCASSHKHCNHHKVREGVPAECNRT